MDDITADGQHGVSFVNPIGEIFLSPLAGQIDDKISFILSLRYIDLFTCSFCIHSLNKRRVRGVKGSLEIQDHIRTMPFICELCYINIMETFLMTLSKQIKNAFSSSDTLTCHSMFEVPIQSPQKLLMQLCANVAGLR